MVTSLEREAAEIATNKPQEAFSAKLRLAWALAHSSRGHADYARAKLMITELLKTTRERQAVQELLYLKAVASLNIDDLIAAHHTVSELLDHSPHSHQGLALKERINGEILRKGLTGIGILAGGLAIGAAVIAKLALRK